MHMPLKANRSKIDYQTPCANKLGKLFFKQVLDPSVVQCTRLRCNLWPRPPVYGAKFKSVVISENYLRKLLLLLPFRVKGSCLGAHNGSFVHFVNVHVSTKWVYAHAFIQTSTIIGGSG
jgi:hypothetical protein